jgi:hypothetical protein
MQKTRIRKVKPCNNPKTRKQKGGSFWSNISHSLGFQGERKLIHRTILESTSDEEALEKLKKLNPIDLDVKAVTGGGKTAKTIATGRQFVKTVAFLEGIEKNKNPDMIVTPLAKIVPAPILPDGWKREIFMDPKNPDNPKNGNFHYICPGNTSVPSTWVIPTSSCTVKAPVAPDLPAGWSKQLYMNHKNPQDPDNGNFYYECEDENVPSVWKIPTRPCVPVVQPPVQPPVRPQVQPQVRPQVQPQVQPQVVQPPAVQSPLLPAGWKEKTHNGKPYYECDHPLVNSVWDKPTEQCNPPPGWTKRTKGSKTWYSCSDPGTPSRWDLPPKRCSVPIGVPNGWVQINTGTKIGYKCLRTNTIIWTKPTDPC